MDAEIPNGRLDLVMPKQDLNSAQVARLLVDEGWLGSTQRMRVIVLCAQSDRRHPFIHQPCILPCAEVPGWITAAGKDEIIERPAPPFQPSEEARARRLNDLELNGLAGLLLDDDRAWRRGATTDDIADFQLHQIAAAQFSVDREVEQRAISQSLFMVEVKPDRPDLFHFKRTLGANEATGIPGPAVVISGVKVGSSHYALHLGAPTPSH
jgi:hypothetical protein